jgi:anti-sigma-K factor RskA
VSARPLPERLLELAADRALVGLGGVDALDLERLLDEHRGDQAEAAALELELAAAELDLALAGSADEPLPEALRAQISAAGQAWVRAPAPATSRPAAPAPVEPETPRATVIPLAGWVVAAAALVLAVLGWLPRDLRPPPSPVDHARAYATLREQPGVVNPAWEATELAPDAAGDVAWSQGAQQGFLHIQGLAPNDPRVEQYQLWILDGEQAHPIDGGVFDLRGDEEWVPIEAKLPVGRPTAFAVTLEKPGGVVVSDQERVVLLAKL